MAETEQNEAGRDAGQDPRARRRAAKADRTAARLAKQIGAFSTRHGGAEGHLGRLGQAGTRIVLVGADGGWGDLMAPSDPVARGAVERAGLTLHDSFEGQFAGRLTTGPYEWRRMAGIQLGGGRAA